jgi:hypothetical protein
MVCLFACGFTHVLLSTKEMRHCQRWAIAELASKARVLPQEPAAFGSPMLSNTGAHRMFSH